MKKRKKKGREGGRRKKGIEGGRKTGRKRGRKEEELCVR